MKARPLRKSLGCSRPATGRMRQPEREKRRSDTVWSWGMCEGEKEKRGSERRKGEQA